MKFGRMTSAQYNLAMLSLAAGAVLLGLVLDVQSIRSWGISLLLFVPALNATFALRGFIRRRSAPVPAIHKPALKSAPLVKPPALRLDRVARFFWSEKTYERVFKPARADLIYEWENAEVARQRWRSRWIKYVSAPYTILSLMVIQARWSIWDRVARGSWTRPAAAPVPPAKRVPSKMERSEMRGSSQVGHDAVVVWSPDRETHSSDLKAQLDRGCTERARGSFQKGDGGTYFSWLNAPKDHCALCGGRCRQR